jgi:two-component system, cell cycle sensor histidine kinase and response regulator CckA
MTFREGSSNVASASRSETSAFRDESSVGHTLNRLCILVIITLIPAIAHNRVEHNYRAITVLSFQAIAAGLAFWLNRRGHSRWASILLSYATLVGAATFVAISRDGLRDPAMLMFSLAIVIGALMLDLRSFVAFCLLIALAVVALWVAERNGLLAADPRQFVGYPFLIDVGLILFITAAASGLLAQSLKASVIETQQSEKRFRTLAEASFEGIAITVEGRFIDANQACCRILGYELSELIGMQASEMIAPSDRQTVIDNIKSGRDAHIETIMLAKDGSARMVEAHGRTVPYQGRLVRLVAIRDITDRKLAERAVLESEEKYRRLVELSPDAIVVHDYEHFYFVNPAAVALLGARTAEEIMNRNFGDLVDPETMPFVQERAHKLREEGGALPLVERKLLRLDGTVIEVEVSSSDLKEQGKFAVQTVIRDISERKRAERERLELEAQLEQARKLESIGRLAGGIAHDFNNLLTVINGYGDLLLAKLSKGDPLHDAVNEISKAGERAARLTKQLLTLRRNELIEFGPVDLNRLIADDLELLRRLAGAHIETSAALQPGLRLVLADAGQLHQVLMNLAANARDAMPDGGRLTMETANLDLNDTSTAAALGLRPGTYVHMRVADTGMGIDKKTQMQIFDPFFTTKRDSGGSGLGLAIVYGIVRQAGGAVSVESEPGSGATFHIYIPASEASVEEAAMPAGVNKPGFVGSETTVLVVEDQESVRKFTCKALDGYGFRILEAANGDAALELARSHQGPIHLLLTDVIMPGMNGRELAERIVPIRPEIRVVYMSGYTEDVIVQRGLLQQGLHYIAKPFAPQALVQKVADALAGGSRTA